MPDNILAVKPSRSRPKTPELVLSGCVFPSLSEDVLIYIFALLEPPDILNLSETCKELSRMRNLRIVWTNACQNHVIANGYPFSPAPLHLLPLVSLMKKTLSAFFLARRWVSGIQSPRKKGYIAGTSGTSVSQVRFLPGHGDRFLLTVSKSIWSAVSVWDMHSKESKKVGEWSPRGVIFNGFAVNSDEDSEATVAISVQLDGELLVKMLHIEEGLDATCSFHEVYSVTTTMKPMTLAGDVLALSDEISQTAIWNWKNGTCATLEPKSDNPSTVQYNDCIQVVFTHQSVLVVRARSIHLFPYPELKAHDPNSADPLPEPYDAIAHHSFGWVDGVSVSICPHLTSSSPPRVLSTDLWQPLSILVRGESDDPWASDVHNLELYILSPNVDYQPPDDGPSPSSSPYLFPPRLSYRIPCTRGTLRCTHIALGRFGTAVWIQPQERSLLSLLADHLPSRGINECLKVAVIPGSLSPPLSRPLTDEDRQLGSFSTSVGWVEGIDAVHSQMVFVNETNNWTSFDYDEIEGRIALGSSYGRVTILHL